MSKKIADTFEEQVGLIDPSKPVRCYRNLNRRLNGEAGFWSVKQGGTVKFHCRKIVLTNVTFLVNENGRQQVLATKQKTVHAYVVGYIYPPISFIGEEVYYNPYTCSNFMIGKDPILRTGMVMLVKSDNRMKVFAKQMWTEATASDTIETVAVHLL